ncbi:YjbE family integral membrane protein [Rhizomicrobium palustre]|uniref:YjbE family integral membrane protein n=1 Tax=Rhizomicrobium palustre TaxID=189966 RepID=A0A846MXA0_9PROT|nr:TerC family protein [Rhizomicrobium palustre]NIK87771.1 YjbE family integral membrane protein [Rhizomicrobium palustre]
MDGFTLTDIFSEGALFALAQVLLIDVVLAGDNAVVIGMAAAQVNKSDRRTVIFWGLVTAVALRIVLAVFAVHLLKFVPLVIAGGFLLLWVTWRLWRDIQHSHKEQQATKVLSDELEHEHHSTHKNASHAQVVRRAIISIAAADVSMSLDNVLAVAGAARDHVEVLLIGLSLSIALMGLAATLIAKLLHKYPWISYAGVFIVLFVALRMIWDGFERLNTHGMIEASSHLMGMA